MQSKREKKGSIEEGDKERMICRGKRKRKRNKKEDRERKRRERKTDRGRIREKTDSGKYVKR